MVEQATVISDPLRVAGLKAPGEASDHPHLWLSPSSSGVQHCEVVAMRDSIENKTPSWLKGVAANLNWAVKLREIDHRAPVHSTVDERFALAEVEQPEGRGPYRPLALGGHDKFNSYYTDAPAKAVR